MVHSPGADRLHPVETRTLVTWSRSGCYHFRIGDRMGSAAQRMQWGRARACVLVVWSVLWSEGEEKLGAQPLVFPHRFPPHSYWLLPLPWEGDGQASWTEGSKEPSAAHVTRD